MGNNHSQSTGRRVSDPQQQWTHSFPRDLQRMPHLKVLPEGGLHQRLRTTNNGAILNSEGTIRGRRNSFHELEEDYHGSRVTRSRSVHESQPENSMFHRTRTQMYRDRQGHVFNIQAKKFGSEPDLRLPSKIEEKEVIESRNRMSRGRKKYKAPAPPLGSAGEGSSPESYHWELASGGDTSDSQAPQRKLRLFKTRAETHRHGQHPHGHQRIVNDIKLKGSPNQRREFTSLQPEPQDLGGIPQSYHKINQDKRVLKNSDLKVRPVMQRSLSSPEFQAELRAVTEKLRIIDRNKFIDPSLAQMAHPVEDKPKVDIKPYNNRKPNYHNDLSNKSKMVTMDHHNILAKQRLIKSVKENVKPKIEEEKRVEQKPIEEVRAPPAPKVKEIESSRKIENKYPQDDFKIPTKTFYFGMDENEENRAVTKVKNTVNLEKSLKATPVHNLDNLVPYKIQHSSSESALSSEMEMEETPPNSNDISMKLRPTLPKKQLDIPRFSPASAWRLLSAIDLHSTNTFQEHEEGPVMMEERIERLSRPVNLMPLLGHRSSHDKSGDSGISGDAVPTLLEDISDPPPLPTHQKSTPIIRPPLATWTPQQDLDEEGSSSDGGLEISKSEGPADVKFHARNHVFSLSLPRESHIAAFTADVEKSRNAQSFNSLQKLRKSLGAALGTKTKIGEDLSPEVDDNWFLSTSAPHSLNHSSSLYKVPQIESDEEEEKEVILPEPTMLKSPSFTYLANGGHVMYLPTIDKLEPKPQHEEVDGSVELRNKPSMYTQNKRNNMVKSIEIPCRKEFNQALKRLPLSKSCENISGEMKQINRTPSPTQKSNPRISNIEDRKNNKNKPKRFTFQSTVRQIERRRIADKLSKEAERKEKQRLGELEAMRRVEEEFQRKRAREKASIRQQLRLYSLDENHHLPDSHWDNKQLRSEPDGAVSSSPSSSPTNNIEFHHPRYKDKHTPYIGKLVDQKMSKQREENNNITNLERSKENQRSLAELSKRINKSNYRSSPVSRSSDDGRIKTEVLSEFRQPTRDYRDYRSYPRYVETPENPTTVHPKVVYNIPKAKQGNAYHEAEGSASPHSDNYRRNFAHGAIPTSSDSELSQPNTRTHSPRHLPRARARSASSERSEENKIMPIDEDKLSEDTSLVAEVEEEPIIVNNMTSCRFFDDSVIGKVQTNLFNPDLSLPIMNLTNPQPFNPGQSFKPVTFNIK